MTDVRTVPVANVDPNPWQPRKEFRTEDLNDLASSIKRHGLLQPLVVVATANGRYRLIAGERRLRAAKLAGLKEVSAVVRTATDEESLELALVENIQRQDLNPLERARGYEQLMKRFGLTQEEVGKKVAKSRAVIANSLRLLALPEQIQRAIEQGRLTEGHAKVIVGLESRDLQMRFFDRVVQTGASVRETEEAARQMQRQKKKKGRTDDDTLREYRELLERHLSTKVEIHGRKGVGTLTAHFYSDEELEQVVRKILGRSEN